MTGYGEGEATGNSVSVTAEVRAVNNRYLKINFRSNERVGQDETWAEKIVRQYIKRGTVHVQLQTFTEDQRNRFHINAETLNAYREELQDFQRHHPMDGHVTLASLLNLPGVIEEVAPKFEHEEVGPLAERALEAALKNLNDMRSIEGRAMGEDMLENIENIKVQLARIEQRVPQVINDYTVRIHERVTNCLLYTSPSPRD